MKYWIIILICIFFTVGGLIGYYHHLYGGATLGVAIKRVMSTCIPQSAQRSAYIGCLRKNFSSLIRSNNVGIVMSSIESLMTPDKLPLPIPGTIGCHEVGHVVGEIAAATGAPLPYLMHACGASCGYGCAHGVVVGLLRKQPDIFVDPNRLCVSQSGYTMTQVDAIACHHGMGHAMAEYSSYNLQRALALCERFDSFQGKEQCTTGVFMEIFDAPTSAHIPQAIPQDAFVFCKNIPSDLYDVCIRQVASKQFASSRDVRVGYKTCQQLPADLAHKCVVAIGSEVYFYENGNPLQIVHMCSADLSFTASCIEGAITSSLVIDVSGDRGRTICHEAGGSLEDSCLTYMRQEQEIMREVKP